MPPACLHSVPARSGMERARKALTPMSVNRRTTKAGPTLCLGFSFTSWGFLRPFERFASSTRQVNASERFQIVWEQQLLSKSGVVSRAALLSPQRWAAPNNTSRPSGIRRDGIPAPKLQHYTFKNKRNYYRDALSVLLHDNSLFCEQCRCWRLLTS